MPDRVIEVRVTPECGDRFAPGAFDRQIGKTMNVGPIPATLTSAAVDPDGQSAVLRFNSPSDLAAEAFGMYSIGLDEADGRLQSRAIPAREHQS